MPMAMPIFAAKGKPSGRADAWAGCGVVVGTDRSVTEDLGAELEMGAELTGLVGATEDEDKLDGVGDRNVEGVGVALTCCSFLSAM